MRKFLSVTFIIFCLAYATAPEKCFAESSIIAGAGVINFSSGSIGKLEYEGLISAGNTFAGKISFIGRASVGRWNGDDVDGDLSAFEGGLHLYPDYQGKLERLFIGWTIGYRKSKWKYVNYDFEHRESASSSTITIGGEVGYRFNFSSKGNISIIPSLQVLLPLSQKGAFHSEMSYEADSMGSGTTFVVFSLSAGFNF
jgi:hypothetical protein